VSVPARFAVSVSLLSALAVGVGVLMADDDEMIEWPITVGLAALAIAGEGFRTWLRRSR
jgi:hypothetical protein